MLDEFTQPYQLPYRIMVPKRVDGLLIPVAASATHVAFSTIRMEPTWMALGQAAGTAAHLAIESEVPPRAVNVDALQRLLLQHGQALTFFRDIDPADPAHAAIQYFGAKGFFTSYVADSRRGLDQATARRWARLAGRSAPADWNVDRALTWRELAGWLGSPAARDGSAVVSRGEFCRMLFERRPAFGSVR